MNRRSMTDSRARFTAGDVRQLLLLAFFAPAALLPEVTWPRICGVAVWIERLFARGRWRELERRAPPELVRRANVSSLQFLVESERRAFEDYLQILRCHTPMGWKPQIDISGLERVESALSRGHGVILWLSGSESSALVSKMAYAQSGLRVSHLTRPTHGFSESAFGIRFLNPVRRRAESRFLREAVMLGDDRTLGALRALHDRLSHNGVVSISIGDQSRAVATFPLLGGNYRIATGPIQLAQSSEAALLPVFCARTGPGSFRVWCDASISPLPTVRDFVPTAARFVETLDRYIAAYPLQWTGWRGHAVEL